MDGYCLARRTFKHIGGIVTPRYKKTAMSYRSHTKHPALDGGEHSYNRIDDDEMIAKHQLNE